MGATREHLKKVGKRFSTDYQPDKKGRKKSRMEAFISEWRTDIDGRLFARSEYFKLLEFLLSCNRNELDTIEQSEDLPVSILTVIRAIKEDLVDCNTRTIEMLIDRIHGRAAQPITAEHGKPLFPNIQVEIIDSREQVDTSEIDENSDN